MAAFFKFTAAYFDLIAACSYSFNMFIPLNFIVMRRHWLVVLTRARLQGSTRDLQVFTDLNSGSSRLFAMLVRYHWWAVDLYGMSIRGVVAHAFGNRILGDVSPDFAGSKFGLTEGVLVQLPDDPAELCFREWGVQEKGKHVSFVWCYVLLVSSISPVSL